MATQFTPEINQTIKITGLEENVKRAKQELEDKIAKLQVLRILFFVQTVPVSYYVTHTCKLKQDLCSPPLPSPPSPPQMHTPTHPIPPLPSPPLSHPTTPQMHPHPSYPSPPTHPSTYHPPISTYPNLPILHLVTANLIPTHLPSPPPPSPARVQMRCGLSGVRGRVGCVGLNVFIFQIHDIDIQHTYINKQRI